VSKFGQENTNMLLFAAYSARAGNFYCYAGTWKFIKKSTSTIVVSVLQDEQWCVSCVWCVVFNIGFKELNLLRRLKKPVLSQNEFMLFTNICISFLPLPETDS
jgi:hypothetical protein